MTRRFAVVVAVALLVTGCQAEEDRVDELERRTVVLLDAIETAIDLTPEGPVETDGPNVGFCDGGTHRVGYRSSRRDMAAEDVRAAVDEIAAAFDGDVRPQDRTEEGGASYSLSADGVLFGIRANVGDGFVTALGSTGCFDLTEDEVQAVIDRVTASR